MIHRRGQFEQFFPSSEQLNILVCVSGLNTRLDKTSALKSAVEWIMERYALTAHKESGIKNNSNDWAAEHNNPQYILDLLLSEIAVGIKTVDITAALPKVGWE